MPGDRSTPGPRRRCRAGGGLLLVDKPSGCTSHDVVGRLRHVLRTRRIGHAGTLDPMATGLLVLAVDRSTKLLGHLALTDKTYLATIRLGQQTDTDDADGLVVARRRPSTRSTDEDIAAGVAALTGPLLQVPSSVSAIKVDGRRAYDRVRAGETVELAARPVTVSRFEILGEPRRLLRRRRSSGRHRSRCRGGLHDRHLHPVTGPGSRRGAGRRRALTRLRRTRVGPFDVAGAVDVFGSDPARRRHRFADRGGGPAVARRGAAVDGDGEFADAIARR